MEEKGLPIKFKEVLFETKCSMLNNFKTTTFELVWKRKEHLLMVLKRCWKWKV